MDTHAHTPLPGQHSDTCARCPRWRAGAAVFCIADLPRAEAAAGRGRGTAHSGRSWRPSWRLTSERWGSR